jgi:branched-chain amino acid transport system substrate-binding protein
MKVKFAARGCAALVLLMALTPLARAAASFDIDVIQALTGYGAFLGKQEHDALQIAEPAINASGGIHGRPVHFIYHDDQTNPQLAVQLSTEIIAKQPPLILGSSLVATCNAMAPLVQAGPVMYCFAAGVHPPPGSYVFSAGVSTRDQANALVRFFRLKGWTRLALATSTDATGQDADRSFDALAALPENKDIKLVERVHFGVNDVSISAQIERVKAAKPQAFIVWSTGSPAGTVFRALVQGGLDIPVGTTGGNMTYAQMTQFAAFLPKQLYLPASEWPVDGDSRVKLDPAVVAKQKAYFAAFAAAGAKPDEGSMLAWDSASIVIDALRALPAGATAQQLHDYLLHLKGQAGVNGIYDFDADPQRGLSLDNVLVTRWNPKAQRWQPVSQPTGIPLEQ